MLQRSKKLGDYSIRAADGKAGEVEGFYFDDASWEVRHIVVRAGGLLANRMVLVAPELVEEADREARSLLTDLTRERVENGPGIKTDRPVADRQELADRERRAQISSGTGWQAAGDPQPGPLDSGGRGPSAEGDPHLRSTEKVAGYGVRAADGEIGHVEDLILDDEEWEIRYVAVETRDWLPGKKVLVSSRWVSRVSWSEEEILVDLTTEEIKTAPEWDLEDPVDRDYEERLHAHYGRAPYWSRR